MKVTEECRKDIEDFLVKNGSPQVAWDVAFHLMKKWKTVNTNNIVDTCRWLGFPVVGDMVYGLND